jgi:hypothetical protein
MKRLAMLPLWAGLFFSAASALPAQTAPPVRVTGYRIDLVLHPRQHAMSARAAVTFFPHGNGMGVSYGLNPALHVSRVTDADDHALQMEQSGDAIRVSSATALPPGQPVTWTFDYGGNLYAPTLTRKNAGR